MLDRAEIEADIARRDPEDLRDAFDALVGWNGASTISGVASGAELMDLFKRVCTAMRGCADRVPPETARLLLQGRGVASPATGAVTYDEAARLALAAHRTWWPAFCGSFPDEG